MPPFSRKGEIAHCFEMILRLCRVVNSYDFPFSLFFIGAVKIHLQMSKTRSFHCLQSFTNGAVKILLICSYLYSSFTFVLPEETSRKPALRFHPQLAKCISTVAKKWVTERSSICQKGGKFSFQYKAQRSQMFSI